LCYASALVLLDPLPASAQSPAPSAAASSQEVSVASLRGELARLRQEFEALRVQYGRRLVDLEARIATLEMGGPDEVPPPPPAPAEAAVPPVPAEPTPAAPTPSGAPPQEVTVPQGAAGGGGPTGQIPVYGGATALSKIFNPDIAVIGNFIGAVGEDEVDDRPVLAMDEAEASFQAIVDPFGRADFFVAFGQEEVELEEGYLTLTALPAGLLTKVGKMKAQFGKTNTLHPHQLPFVDQPLVLRNLLGGDEGLVDSGVSVSKLILNPWMFLEATGEVLSGNSGAFRSYERSDVTWLGRLRAYRDLTESTNLDLGTSIAFGRNELGEDSRTRLVGIDATLRYRPLRRAIYRRLLARGELMWNRAEASEGEDAATAFGMYIGGEYQFARRWFAGARYDYAERAFEPALNDQSGAILLTFWPSEFSQIRGQFRRTRYAEGTTGSQLLFQFLFSIGAHGAHQF
jgi:hypothetical protein